MRVSKSRRFKVTNITAFSMGIVSSPHCVCFHLLSLLTTNFKNFPSSFYISSVPNINVTEAKPITMIKSLNFINLLFSKSNILHSCIYIIVFFFSDAITALHPTLYRIILFSVHAGRNVRTFVRPYPIPSTSICARWL